MQNLHASAFLVYIIKDTIRTKDYQSKRAF